MNGYANVLKEIVFFISFVYYFLVYLFDDSWVKNSINDLAHSSSKIKMHAKLNIHIDSYLILNIFGKQDIM